MKNSARVFRLYAAFLLIVIAISFVAFNYYGINPQFGLYTRSNTQSKFQHIIDIPGLVFMGNWKDSDGNVCLFAGTINRIGKEYPRELLIFDAQLNEIARIIIEDHTLIIDSFTAAIIEYYEEGKPSVIAYTSTNPYDRRLSAFNFAGEKIHEISFPESVDGIASLQIVDSPTQLGKKVVVLLCPPSGYGGAEYRFFDLITGKECIEDAKVISSNLSAIDPFCDILILDWNLDGNDDALYWSAPSVASGKQLLPVTAGKIEAPINVEPSFIAKATKVIRYVEDGNIKTLMAGLLELPPPLNDYSFSLLNYIMPEKAPRHNVIWQHPDSANIIIKEFDGPFNSYLNLINIELADLTGDGVPEIAAVVERTRLVIYDIAGMELYSEILKPRRSFKAQMGFVTAGDFDGDGYMDLAIADSKGIYLPDLSALRKNQKANS